MRLVVEPSARSLVERSGGAVYIWPRCHRCCGGRTYVLESSTEPGDRDFELVHAADGLRVFATPGLLEPEELHLEVGRRGALNAFWNGQGWIG